VSNDAFDLAWGLTKQNALSRFRTARDAERLRLQNQGARSRQRYSEMARQQRPPRSRPQPQLEPQEPVEGPTGPPPTPSPPEPVEVPTGPPPTPSPPESYDLNEFREPSTGSTDLDYGRIDRITSSGKGGNLPSLSQIRQDMFPKDQQQVTATPPSLPAPQTDILRPYGMIGEGGTLIPSGKVSEIAPKAFKPAEPKEEVTTDPKIEEAAKVIAEPEPQEEIAPSEAVSEVAPDVIKPAESEEEVTADPKIEEAAKQIPKKKTPNPAPKKPNLKTPSKKEESKERPKTGFGSSDDDYNPRTGKLWGKGSKKGKERMSSYEDTKDPKIEEAAKQIPKKKTPKSASTKPELKTPSEEEGEKGEKAEEGLPKDVDVKPIEPVEEAKPPLLESEGKPVKPVEPEAAKLPKGQDSFTGQEPIAAALAETSGKKKTKPTEPNLKSPPKENTEKKKLPNLFPTSKDVKSNFNNVINMALDDNDAEAARHIFNSLDPDLAAELGMDEDQASEIRDAMRNIYRS
jgi:hypothetical protein